MVDGKNNSGWEKFDVSAGTKIYGLVHRMKPTEAPKLSSKELKSAVDEATNACGHLKERYGKCYKNWQKSSLMRGGDMRLRTRGLNERTGKEMRSRFKIKVWQHAGEHKTTRRGSSALPAASLSPNVMTHM
jgi:hypothetical protein